MSMHIDILGWRRGKDTKRHKGTENYGKPNMAKFRNKQVRKVPQKAIYECVSRSEARSSAWFLEKIIFSPRVKKAPRVFSTTLA